MATRHQIRSADVAMGDALCLHHETLARGAGPAHAACALVPFAGARVAALFRSETAPESARVAVLSSRARDATPQFTTLSDGERAESSAAERAGDAAAAWGGAWSPDGRLLVVYGVAPRASDGQLDAAVWVLTKNEWIHGQQDERASEREPPLVMRVDVRDSLAKDAAWRAAKATSSRIAGAFFHASSPSRCFLVTQDGWIVKMEIEVAALLVQTRSGAREADPAAFTTMQSLMRLTNWHAGVTAMAFEMKTSTLVIGGGLKNPSDELRAQGASSLSVWEVSAMDPFVELMDYTMVMGSRSLVKNASDEKSASEHQNASTKSSGIVGKVRHSFLNPLKMLHSSEDDGETLPGAIRHLSISSDGVFLSILNQEGAFRIRQIDACADVVDWQFANCGSIELPIPVDTIGWLGPSSMAFLTRDHTMCFGFLASNDDIAANDEESDGTDGAQSHRAGIGIQVVFETHLTDERFENESRRRIQEMCLVLPNAEADSDVTRAFTIYNFNTIQSSTHVDWQVTTLENTPIGTVVQALIHSREYVRALDIVEFHRTRGCWAETEIDLDCVYQELWASYRASATIDRIPPQIFVLSTEESFQGHDFDEAMNWLNRVDRDRRWVVNQCLEIVASASLLQMKEILATGLRALLAVPGGEIDDNLNHFRTQLLRYLYRVDTLNQLIIAELDDEGRRSLADEQCFEGTAFATFRDASIIEIACDLAKQARIKALTVLFQRNAFNLLPHRTRILELIPASVSPRIYSHLLPAIGPESNNEWQFYTLSCVEAQDFAISEVSFVKENHSHDLSSQELQTFEECVRKDPNQRRDEYALWFTHRMVELDSMYGQLGTACELGRCGRVGLLNVGIDRYEDSMASKSAVVSSTPFEEFLEHCDRFYKCIYELDLSALKTLSLEDWSLLSLHDQFMAVVMEGDELQAADVDILLHRLRKVFLEQRRHNFALDEVVSWLCQVLMSQRGSSNGRDSLKKLHLCAQLIHQSSPASNFNDRWIQDDARLLRTAIDVIFAASTPSDGVVSGESGDVKVHHQHLVDQLWLIFQSLPERKPDDGPQVSQLQVEVDGLEDLLIAMDVLANYGILTCPSELRNRVAREDQGGRSATESAVATELVEAVCSYGFQRGVSWTILWQNVSKLKTHVFGERVTQEVLLSILLRHMVSLYRCEGDKSSYLSDSHELILNWITANVGALQYPMDILLDAVGRRIDEGDNEEASQIVALAQAMLALPVVEATLSVHSVRKKFETVMAQEQNCLRVRELLGLLTYGAVKISRSALRELHTERDRLNLILQVYSSNPSNYKMSTKAQGWLRGELQLSSDASLDIVLGGVTHLAHLLRIRKPHQTKIVLKAAYSALYCLDFDVTHRLATKLIIEFEESAPDHGEKSDESDEELTLLLSLVLDLISSSSFRSWSKKIDLVKLLFTAKNPRLFTHPIADLIFERAHLLEAAQSLATELGLSETELEERRVQDESCKLSAEGALLRELELVVDLLREERTSRKKEDRDFVFRLLQKGLQLVVVLQSQSRTPIAPSSPSLASQPPVHMNDAWLSQVVPQLATTAFQDAYALLTESNSDEWVETAEIGFSYLLFLSQLQGGSTDSIKRVWCDEVLEFYTSRGSELNSSRPSEPAFKDRERLLVEKFGHFFRYLAASSVVFETTLDLNEMRRQLEMLRSSRVALDFVRNQQDVETDVFEEDFTGEQKSNQRSAVFDSYMVLANECEALLHSQEKSQELEAVASFLNDDVDLEQFSVDPDYRLSTIRRMSKRKENISTAKAFASKYGIDEFECVLAYIWHAFFPENIHNITVSRQEQLEQAFRGADDSGGDDFLEQALQRPLAFGDFLLRSETGVFESLPGTDHVGILLVLRSILECSKRVKDTQESEDTNSLLPLSKSSSDRVTLLFMCLKRLKETSTSGKEGEPDFKLVCGARTTRELLHGSENPDESQAAAVTAIAPFLTNKSIKMLTKVLQKLHQINPSAIVMVFLNDMLSKIWHEQEERGIAPNPDLAAYAYESCVPFLSVLTLDHLAVFQRRFVKCDVSTSFASHFYGQELLGLSRFGSLLTAAKRAEVISEILNHFHSRTNPSKASESNMVKEQEEELVEAAFWFVIDSISQNSLLNFVEGTHGDSVNWLGGWKTRLAAWFALDALQKTNQEDQILNAFVMFCERSVSLDLATLSIELALGLTSSSEFVARAVQDIYCKGVSDVIYKVLTREGGEVIVHEMAAHWATSMVNSTNQPSNPSAEELKLYITSLDPQQASSFTPSSAAHNDIYGGVLNHLENLASPLIRDIVSRRREKMSSTKENSSSLRTAVISQWKAVVSQYEEQRNWMTSAFLSHVLIESSAFEEEDRRYDFGLRVKAVCEWLNHYHPSDLWSDVLAVPTSELFSNFEAQVFDRFLAIVESFASSAIQSSKHVTVALAALVRTYSQINGSFEPAAAQDAWKREKESALLVRLCSGDEVAVNGNSSGQEPDRMWAALLVQGIWDERLMQWYTFVAYDKLSTAEPIAEYVRVRGDVNPALTIMLLLVCPFQNLRDQHEAHILANAKHQLLAAGTSQATKARLLELLLLRFDLQVLLDVDGIETVLRTFHLEPSAAVNKSKLLSWTSTAEYYVCRLVQLREYATAGRLVCALWNAHPMLWDLENARLVLGNYLASLVKQSSRSSSRIGEAVRQARSLAYDHYQRELL